ncbi:MAG TPA: universal stress protein [Syntrophobacter fumaroxidans]|nr:universal stress protein [Syntrophobacter fumaroxidans]
MTQPPGIAGKSMEGCVMLAISTFRRSERAIDVAIEEAREIKKLLVVYIADSNLARYMVDADQRLFGELRESVESNVLERHEKEGWEHVEEIAERAEKEGIEVKTHVQVGQFAVICLEAIKTRKPSLVVTTRSQRPAWVKRFFGAPVDELIKGASCPVTVV